VHPKYEIAICFSHAGLEKCLWSLIEKPHESAAHGVDTEAICISSLWRDS